MDLPILSVVATFFSWSMTANGKDEQDKSDMTMDRREGKIVFLSLHPSVLVDVGMKERDYHPGQVREERATESAVQLSQTTNCSWCQSFTGGCPRHCWSFIISVTHCSEFSNG